MCRLEDGDITIVFVSLVVVLSLGKQVGLHVLGAGLVMEGEVVFHELGDLVHLSSIQLLRELEVLEVLVIHPDFYVLCGAHEVVALFRKCKHDC